MSNEICEFRDCEEVATTYDEAMHSWLCERHENGLDNPTGYCSRDCQLGYGCDGSC